MPQQTLAITIGDPAGIGPEISLKAAHRLAPRTARGELRLVLIGDTACLSDIGSALDLPVPPMAQGVDPAAWPEVCIVEAGPPRATVRLGTVSAEAGRQAYEAVAKGVDLALKGQIGGIVTAPLSKEALHLAGYRYAGHTEMLADLTAVADSVMMLAHGNIRVSHVSTHIALEDVPRRVTPERLRRVIDLTLDVLRRLGIAQPRIAVAALNPHAGEGGLFGRHDITVTAPMVEDYQRRGEAVVGPIPGDTVFVKLRGGQYDAVVAMYHDQGHIPVKLLGFEIDRGSGQWTALSGVNVTLGLPIVRTSVDHGTAFDIAGQGVASETSLVEAVDYALRLAVPGAPSAVGDDAASQPVGS